jgi:hypothetical protein
MAQRKTESRGRSKLPLYIFLESAFVREIRG